VYLLVEKVQKCKFVNRGVKELEEVPEKKSAVVWIRKGDRICMRKIA
jgi:hypothetical protein